jgi:hypothetical protein
LHNGQAKCGVTEQLPAHCRTLLGSQLLQTAKKFDIAAPARYGTRLAN